MNTGRPPRPPPRPPLRPVDRPDRPSAFARPVTAPTARLEFRGFLPCPPRSSRASSAPLRRRHDCADAAVVAATPRGGTRAPAMPAGLAGGITRPGDVIHAECALRSIVAIVRGNPLALAVVSASPTAVEKTAKREYLVRQLAAPRIQAVELWTHIAEHHVSRLSWRRDERFPTSFPLFARTNISCTRDIISPGRSCPHTSARGSSPLGQFRPIIAWLPTRLRLWARRARSRPSTLPPSPPPSPPRGYWFHRRGGEDPRARRRERGRSQGAPREFKGRVPDGEGVPAWAPTLPVRRGHRHARITAWLRARGLQRAASGGDHEGHPGGDKVLGGPARNQVRP